MKRWSVISTCLVLLTSSAGLAEPAQHKPDFSGTWVLDASSTGLNALGSVRATALVQKQTASQLTVESRAGDRPETATYDLSGNESLHKLPGGLEVKSKTTWEGPSLVTRSARASGEQMTAIRSLSADGKVMTLELTTTTGRGDAKQKLVYRKQ